MLEKDGFKIKDLTKSEKFCIPRVFDELNLLRGEKMAQIKSLTDIQEKWATVTPQRSGEYVKGVQSPKVDWAAATKAAESSYNEGITRSIAAKSFARGVTAAGTERWKDKATNLGSQRWGSGVAAAASDFGAGFAPYRETIASLVLPPRYPKGDERNYLRTQAIGKALNAKRLKG